MKKNKPLRIEVGDSAAMVVSCENTEELSNPFFFYLVWCGVDPSFLRVVI